MIKKGISSGIFILFVLWSPLFPQGSPDDVTAEKTFYQAHFLTLYDRWEEALPLYLRLAEEEPDNTNVQYLTGVCYLHLPGLKAEAIPWLEKAVKGITKKYEKEIHTERQAPREAWLMLGKAYQIAGELDKAIEAYNRYKKSLKKKESRDEADRMIRSCDLARRMLQEKPDIDLVQPELLKVGKVNYHPAVSGDGKTMVFMSDAKYYHAIYFTRFSEGAWEVPVNITMDIQSDGSYRVASLNRDGTILFLTVPGKDNYNIYVSHWRAGDQRWGKAVPLKGRVNTLKNEIFASLSPDGQELYFVSDRSTGEGGYDIFTAHKNQEGAWDDIKPLGPPVNTPLNERSPILTHDGNKLYFSSDGHQTMGGYDIFVSEKKGGKWSAPVNLGHPPNTTDDDLFYVPADNGVRGYFTSYSVRAPKHAYITMAEYFSAEHPRPVVVTGHLQVAGGAPLPEDIKAEIREISSDTPLVVLEHIPGDGTFTTKLPTGKYTITVTGSGLRETSREIDLQQGATAGTLEISLEQLPSALPAPLQEHYAVRPVYFAFNKYTLSPSSIATLDTLVTILKRFPKVTVVVEGHTDALGSDAYNMKLSLQRAGTVRDYLIRHGIAGSRLSVKGYGKSRPVAINRNADGTDNPAGRALNRRATYKFNGAGAENITVKQNIPEDLSVKKQ